MKQRDYFRTPQQEWSGFEEWAFGTPMPHNALRRLEAWNRRHGDKRRFDPYDGWLWSICHMWKFYEEQGGLD
jgi:hypothetical protein